MLVEINTIFSNLSLIIINPEEYARSHAPLSDTEAAMPSARPGSMFGHGEDVCR